MKRLIKISIIVYYFMITASFGADKIVASSINGKLLNPLKVHSDYSFLLAGHIYGSHNKSIFPAASLLANIELLNDLKPDFMVLLGDIVSGCNELEFAKLRESFLTKVTFPVFNAVGNHDVPNDDLRVLYEKHFGKTFFSFEVG